MSLLQGLRTAVQVLSGQQPPPIAITEDGIEQVRRTAPLDPRKVQDYNELDFATLVAQGRVRCIEWHVIRGIEVGFDHDLMVWCSSPGRFHDVPEDVA